MDNRMGGVCVCVFVSVRKRDFPDSLSRHSSLSLIASGRSSRLHPVSADVDKF